MVNFLYFLIVFLQNIQSRDIVKLRIYKRISQDPGFF